MKLVIRLLAFILLFIATSAGATSDYGDPAISRLWDGDNFQCTVSYIFPYISDYGSWVVTAGHCADSNYLKQNADSTVSAVVNWRGVLLGNPRYTEDFRDLAIGTAPDVRDNHKHLWLADEMPHRGVVYIHGCPAGIERVSLGIVLPYGSPDTPGAVLVAVKAGEIMGGSSGSPVLREDGRVVGILWGVMPEASVGELNLPVELPKGYDVVAVTPVERLHELMKLLGVKQ